MAKFNESGLPSEFLTLIRKLEAEIQDKKNHVATEKQLIDGGEKEICEKNKAIRLQQEKNTELEKSIKHLLNVLDNQTTQRKSAKEAGRLMQEQLKIKLEKLELLRENNQKIKNDCTYQYEKYKNKLSERMAYYDMLPLVPEYRRITGHVSELHKSIDVMSKEEGKLLQEVELLQHEKDASKSKFSTIVEWGVTVAKLMLKLGKNNEHAHSQASRIKNLHLEIGELKKRKQAIFEDRRQHFKNAAASPISSDHKTISGVSNRKIFSQPAASGSFFNQSFAINRCVTGSSGSSLQGTLIFGSLPNIAATCSSKKLTEKKPCTLVGQGDSDLKNNGSKIAREVDASNVFSQRKVKINRSQSLTSLLPKVGDLKTSLQTSKSHSVAGQSLSDWLSSPKKIQQGSGDADMETDAIKKDTTGNLDQECEEKSNKSDINTRFSWPLSSSSTYSKRMTEVPLLRQIQEKIIQQKMNDESERHEETVTKSDVDTPAEAKIEHKAEELPKIKPKVVENLYSYFDGPCYDVPMPSMEEEEMRQENQHNAQGDEINTLIDFTKMLADLQKSPEERFPRLCDVMQTENKAPTFSSFEQSSSDRNGTPVTSDDFVFAVPTIPPLTPGRRNVATSENLFNFGQSQPPQSPQTFGVFNLGESDNSTCSTPAFSFAINEPSTPGAKSSFIFGSEDGSPSPSSSNVGFSFNTGSPTSIQSLDTSTDEDSSFASLFRCLK